jgi:hypothetical protein
VARAIVTVDYILGLDDKGILSRLSASVLGGRLHQSLVVATPSRQGQTYLQSLYNDVHHTSSLYGKALYGKALYYTTMKLSDKTRADLKDWWHLFLHKNPGNRSRAGYMSTVGVSWGNGSGTGTGGTFEFAHNNEDPILTWMGTWSPLAVTHDSNWRELRTLLWTMERLDRQGADLQGGTLFYFTDNLVSYYIVHNGSSTSRELHKLIRRIKILEIKMDCRVELVHVPGKLMIEQCTDGLSRGIWASPERVLCSFVEESWLALTATPYSPLMVQWALHLVGHLPNRVFVHHHNTSDWTWSSIGDQITTRRTGRGHQLATRPPSQHVGLDVVINWRPDYYLDSFTRNWPTSCHTSARLLGRASPHYRRHPSNTSSSTERLGISLSTHFGIWRIPSSVSPLGLSLPIAHSFLCAVLTLLHSYFATFQQDGAYCRCH